MSENNQDHKAPDRVEEAFQTAAFDLISGIAAQGISLLQEHAHATAVLKGWHDHPDPKSADRFGTMIALCHSELSEALESYRDQGVIPIDRQAEWREGQKPEGVTAELADVVIRIFDMSGLLDLDLAGAIVAKMKYNATRPHRHGGKRL